MIEFIFGVIFWVGLAIFAGYHAKSRERSGFGHFMLSMFLISPVLDIIAVALLPNLRNERIAQERHDKIVGILILSSNRV